MRNPRRGPNWDRVGAGFRSNSFTGVRKGQAIEVVLVQADVFFLQAHRLLAGPG